MGLVGVVLLANASRVFHSNAAPGMAVTIQGNDEYSKNLFEVMGNLVAFMETNNQTGIQQSLANLKEAQGHIMNAVAEIGGPLAGSVRPPQRVLAGLAGGGKIG